MSMWLSHISNLEVKPVLPVLCGREEDEDNEDKGAGGAGSGEDNAGGGNGAGGTGDDKGGSQGDPQKKIAAQDEIIERLSRQREERDAELQELREYREQAENAKLSDKEKIDKQIEDLTKANESKDATLQKLVVNNAFLSANDVTWHDPETALSLIDISDFEIVVDEKTGIPAIKDKKGFAEAIAKLAESKPYLVKTQSDDDEEDGKPGPRAWKGKTGDTPKPKASEKAAERERLKSKYPALRGR